MTPAICRCGGTNNESRRPPRTASFEPSLWASFEVLESKDSAQLVVAVTRVSNCYVVWYMAFCDLTFSYAFSIFFLCTFGNINTGFSGTNQVPNAKDGLGLLAPQVPIQLRKQDGILYVSNNDAASVYEIVFWLLPFAWMNVSSWQSNELMPINILFEDIQDVLQFRVGGQFARRWLLKQPVCSSHSDDHHHHDGSCCQPYVVVCKNDSKESEWKSYYFFGRFCNVRSCCGDLD